MALDVQSLWEAFVGGGSWGYAGDPLSRETTQEQYQTRTTAFYDELIGPAFGYDRDPDTPGVQGGFGTDYAETFPAFERGILEAEEREFQLAIGDPFGRESLRDPFEWEELSRYRYAPEESIGEAQKLLQEQVYGYGASLGGTIGADWQTGRSTSLEEMKRGLGGLREGLEYGELTAGVGLQSGTSGAVIRSGGGLGDPEDILDEAYIKAKGLGTEYMLDKEQVELDLKTNLDKALDDYMDAIQDEKGDWYDRVMNFAGLISGMTSDEGGVSDVFTGLQEDIDMSEYAGLEYDPEEWQDGVEYGEACGIGELFVDGECQPIEGLEFNEYGELIGTGGGLYGFTCWDGTNVASEEDCPVQTEICWDGSEAEMGQCPEEPECQTNDDCSICNQCNNGDCVPVDMPGAGCDPECPYGQSVDCANGGTACSDETMHTDNCPPGQTDPDGEIWYDCDNFGSEWNWNPVMGECVYDPDGGYNFPSSHCYWLGCDPGLQCSMTGSCFDPNEDEGGGGCPGCDTVEPWGDKVETGMR